MKTFILQKSQHICFRISFGVIFAWQAIGQAISMNDMESSAASQFHHKSSCQSAVQKQKRKRFSPKEDLLLCQLVQTHGTSSWEEISSIMNRPARQCRERWIHFLSNKANRPTWTKERDALLLDRWHVFGNNWKKIAMYFKEFSATQIHYRLLKLVKQGARSLNQDQEAPDVVEQSTLTELTETPTQHPFTSDDLTETPIENLGNLLTYEANFMSPSIMGSPRINSPFLHSPLVDSLFLNSPILNSPILNSPILNSSRFNSSSFDIPSFDLDPFNSDVSEVLIPKSSADLLKSSSEDTNDAKDEANP